MTGVRSFPRIQISLGPRPGKKSLKRLQDLNLTHCCTLLSAREGAAQIEKICAQLGTAERPCKWVWLPIEGGKTDVLRQTNIVSLIATLHDAIADTPDAHIYLHCSAGIHRTGFFAYILLRLMGHNRAAALDKLADLRDVTSNQVGDERIDVAEAFFTGQALT